MNFIEKNTKKVALFLCLATVSSAVTTVYAASNSSGWQSDGVYVKEDGEVATGWLVTEEGTFYCDENGMPLIGWQTIKNETYFFNSLGMKVSGEQVIDGHKYTFTQQGNLLVGWSEDNKSYYDNYGTKVTGLQKIEDKWVQFDETGVIKSGWSELEGKKVYFNENGMLATGEVTVEGVTYNFREDGTYATGWQEANGEKFYYDDFGFLTKGWATIADKKYYFNKNGEMLEDTEYAGYKFDVDGVATEIEEEPEQPIQNKTSNSNTNNTVVLNPVGSGGNATAAGIASAQVGSGYVWGGTAPGGFDCSGLTTYAYAQVGIRLPRTAGGQASVGSAVSYDSMQAGDLIVWSGGAHVSMYVGNGLMVHATNPRDGVIYSNVGSWSGASGQYITAIRRP